MQTTQPKTFEAPEGYQIESADAALDRITLVRKPKNMLEILQTDEDVLRESGHTWESFEKWCVGLAKHERAQRFVGLLVDLLNGGWIADFDNDNQWKYEPRFLGGSLGFRFSDCGLWLSRSDVGSRLCLKGPKEATHAGTKYTKWYKEIIVKEQLSKAA